MNGEEPTARFLSAVVGGFATAAPLSWFFLGLVADVGTTWWAGVALGLAAAVGLLYGTRSYSLSRLWRFAWAVWKGLLPVYLFVAILFANPLEVETPERLAGRVFIASVGFVVFVMVYGASYQSVYISSLRGTDPS